MTRSILVVAPYLPLPADFGGAIRTYHVIRELAQTNDVMVVAPAGRNEWQHVEQLAEICDVTVVPARSLAKHSAGVLKRASQLRSIVSRQSFLERSTRNAQMQAAVSRLFMTRHIDLVQYEFTQMAVHAPPRPFATVIDAHNIEHELIRRVATSSSSASTRALKAMEARKVKRLEERLWSAATICVATSERDARVIACHTQREPLVVPNGADIAAFSPPPGNRRRTNHIVFTGVLRHQPNIDGVLWYLEHVHPIVRRGVPDVTVSIVGADPPPAILSYASPSVQITGRVPDVRPYLHEASASIVPLFAGGGTRLKIVEAFAASVPVVSTSIGAEGIDARVGTDILIADDPAGFAAKVVDVLTDSDLSRRITASACERAKQHFDWSIVVQPLLDAHDQAIRAARS